jgi:UPF0755 protein
MKIFRRLSFPFLLAMVALAAAFYRVETPFKDFEGEQFVDIPRGTPSGRIAEMLTEGGVVRSRFDFVLARILRRGRTLQAGEYRFTKPASALDVYGRIARGDIFYHELVVPEGWNMFDIAAAVEKLGVAPAGAFLRAARNPAMIRDLDPRAPSLEGYLFPSTYRLSRNTAPEQVCRLMTDQFRAVWRKLGTKAGVHDAVTLASLVEKEGKLAPERPMIAAVFLNRLRIGMKLDCDPTTIYAALLEHRYRGTIYRSDLERESPYNTYRSPGLPPGPIANPGLASIDAVLEPASSDALYFVLRPEGEGAHQFSSTMAAHEQAIARYRRAHRK